MQECVYIGSQSGMDALRTICFSFFIRQLHHYTIDDTIELQLLPTSIVAIHGQTRWRMHMH